MNTTQYNQAVGAWGNATKRKLKLNVLKLVLNIGPGHDNQEVSVKKYHGEASKINFGFPYYMVFVHKGAGRGYGGIKTGTFSRKGGKRGTTNPSSIGKMGTGNRKAKPWFNPVLEQQFPALANIVAQYHGDKVTARLEKILIK